MVDAGEALGWLGDDRDLHSFTPVAGGNYELEDIGKRTVEAFEMARYPVTIEQRLEPLRPKTLPKPAKGGVIGRFFRRVQSDKISVDQAEGHLFLHPPVGDVIQKLKKGHPEQPFRFPTWTTVVLSISLPADIIHQREVNRLDQILENVAPLIKHGIVNVVPEKLSLTR